MMSLDGYMAAPPTILVCSIDCALALGAIANAVIAKAMIANVLFIIIFNLFSNTYGGIYSYSFVKQDLIFWEGF
jgi:hypothetical protein